MSDRENPALDLQSREMEELIATARHLDAAGKSDAIAGRCAAFGARAGSAVRVVPVCHCARRAHQTSVSTLRATRALKVRMRV